MGPTRVNRKLSFESGEEQIKGYGKVTQNTEIFSTKYGNNILEVGSPDDEQQHQIDMISQNDSICNHSQVMQKYNSNASVIAIVDWSPDLQEDNLNQSWLTVHGIPNNKF